MNPENRIGMIRITGEAWRANSDYARDLINRLEPRGGDLLIVRAHPSRASALERSLRVQLVPEGLIDA